MRRQHLAGVHVDDEPGFLLVEADQHTTLLVHALHRKARTVAVAPGWPVQGRQDDVRPDLADAREILFQDALLGGDLRAHLQVLQHAAAAAAVVHASWRGALAALPEDAHRVGAVVFGMPAEDRDFGDFAGQGAIDESDLAVHPADAVALVVEGIDMNHAHAYSFQAARKACQCAPAMPCRAARTLAVSPW